MSEFFADELALILNCSRTAATKLADSAGLLVENLPATWAALADGQLDWLRARALAAELLEPARDLEPAVLAEIEAAVLPRATGLSIRGLQAAARTELLRRDAAAADRRRTQAERAADVELRSARDGMAELGTLMPQPMATTIWRTLDGYARMAKSDGDPRSIGQLRVGVLYDLVTRPWDISRPPVTAHLTVLAPLVTLTTGGSDGSSRGEPAEVDGQPITAAYLRSLLEQLDALCPGGSRLRPAQRSTSPSSTRSAERSGPPLPAANWSGWRDAAARGTPPGTAAARSSIVRRRCSDTAPARRNVAS